MAKVGKGYLIGAGPGDPRLLTLRAVEALREADVILVDDLVHDGVVVHASPTARIIAVGKRCGGQAMPQAMTTRLLVEHVRAGAIVARLKGGDPFVFGRGGEEALALAREGLAFEIIPGVTSALGAAAFAGIPLTFRGLSSSVAFIAGHREDGRSPRVDIGADTLVVFMCQRTIGRIARDLLAAGRGAQWPVAIVRAATWPEQEVYTGCLGELADLADDWYADLDPEPPTLAILGEVAAFATQLAWSGRLPLPLAALLAAAPRLAAGGAR